MTRIIYKLTAYTFLSLLIFSLNSCFTYQDLTIGGVDNVKIDKFNKEEIKLTLFVKINNPNNYKIKVKKSIFDLFVAGKEIGKVKMKEDVVIDKEKEKQYEIALSTTMKDASSSALNALGSAIFSGKVKIRVKGKAKAKVMFIGKKFDVDFQDEIPLGKGMFGKN